MPRSMASWISTAISSSSLCSGSTSARRHSSCSMDSRRARVSPSTSTRTTLFCILMTCLITAIIPTVYKSSSSGSSFSTFFCVTRNTIWSSIMAASSARTDRFLLTSKCATIPGSIAIPRSATAGTFLYSSFMLSLLRQISTSLNCRTQSPLPGHPPRLPS